MVSYVKNLQSDGTIVLISPAWFDLNFLYYYNHDWFKNLNYSDSLHDHSIFQLNNLKQMNTINFLSASAVLYIDAGSEIIDRDHKIFESLSNSFPDNSRQEFPGHMTVYQLKKEMPR